MKFSTPVILVGASPVPIKEALSALQSSQQDLDMPLIAADGGAGALMAIGRIPQIVIGDMDSLSADLTLPDAVQKVYLSGQDDTDFEKCLARIEAPLIIGLGFLEARFDHSLAAIHALMRIHHDRPVMLIGGTDVLLRVRGDFGIDLPIGTRFSVWPLGDQTFQSSKGLLWPLDGLEMAPGNMIGTSNQVSAKRVSITAAKGDGYAIILPLDVLDAVLLSVS